MVLIMATLHLPLSHMQLMSLQQPTSQDLDCTRPVLQSLKQQLKGLEQNSPSHMQVVQQPFSMQVDTDTKMLQLPGFDHERQQLANAMAGQFPCFLHTPIQPLHL